MINFDYSKAMKFISETDIENMQNEINVVHNMLHNKSGVGSELLGWMDLPINFNKKELENIKISAEKIKKDTDIFLVIGIGGSYLGARAAINMLGHTFRNDLDFKTRNIPKVYFVGNNISSKYMVELMDVIKDKDISINVISKSGSTLETALAFRVFREYIEKKYGKDGAKDRIYVTTDKSKGKLKQLSDKEGYKTFVIPDDVGGRYSVLTSVGLLPICVYGFNIDSILEGAADASKRYANSIIKDNDCYQYSVIRNLMCKNGKYIEILANFEPCLNYFGEWWKQLFGESEGKQGKGLFPATLNYSTDLHSMGQYVQEGQKILFETFLNVNDTSVKMKIPYCDDNIDELNYLSGKDFEFLNKKSYEGTILAHQDGGVPVLSINIDNIDEYNLGYLVYFFEKSCAIGGYLLDVNPFTQNGVEKYKKNMFALSGRAGYEKLKIKLEKRL